MLIGAHESISEKINYALDRAKADGCDCVQIFAKNPRMWKSPEIKDKEAYEFKEKAKKLNLGPNASHASYLLNLANPDLKKRKFATINLIDEIKRAEQLGLFAVMFHPGSNPDKEQGLKFVIEGINDAIDKTKEMKALILVENTAGQGNWLGSTLEELKKIFQGVKDKSRFGFCLDTCHLFAAGHDIKNRQKEFFKEFDDLIGLKYIKCFHLNDSMFGLGEKKDRHEHPGKGKIGKKGFEQLMNDKRFKDLPGYLEAPSGNHKENIEYLRNLKK